MFTAEDFVSTMERHWTGELKNVCNGALLKTWRQLGDALLAKLSSQPGPNSKWDILSPPTGSGKTEGVIVFCSMLATLKPEDQPGVLIVTQRTAEADIIASRINELACKRIGQGIAMARSYHSGNRSELSLMALREIPVLVVTHEAFKRALDPLKETSVPWDALYAFRSSGTRPLVVIDEELDLVESYQITESDLNQALGMIPPRVEEVWDTHVRVLRMLSNILRDTKHRHRETNLTEGPALLDHLSKLYLQIGSHHDPIDMMALNDAMQGAKLTGMYKRNNGENGKAFFQSVMWNLAGIVRNHERMWYKEILGEGTFNSSHLMLPEKDAPGVVVLDATAVSNTLYSVFNKANPIPVVPGTRDYSNVTLHVSMGNKTGKTTMKMDPETGANLISNLERELKDKGGEALVVVAKDHKPFFEGFNPSSFRYRVDNWGNLDGSNAYRDCSVVVLFGLPFKPLPWPTNMFQGHQGLQAPGWFANEDLRVFGEVEGDIREAIKVGAMVSDIIQAANRGCCRKTIDSQGNCQPMDLYLLLPSGGLGEKLRAGLESAMPGLKVVPWDYREQRDSYSRSPHEAALSSYFKTMKDGTEKATEVKGTLGIPEKTFKRLIARLRKGDPADPLYSAMVAAGVTYTVERSGRSTTGYFQRATSGGYLLKAS